MITDEQVRLVANILLNAPFGHNPPDDWVADTRKALEAYEANKWVKFDEYDKATYPPFDVRVLVKLKGGFGVSIDFMTHILEWYDTIRLSYVTHWQPLPTFKE